MLKILTTETLLTRFNLQFSSHLSRGQQFAQQMTEDHTEVVERLREQMHNKENDSAAPKEEEPK